MQDVTKNCIYSSTLLLTDMSCKQKLINNIINTCQTHQCKTITSQHAWTQFNKAPTYLMYVSGWITLLILVSMLMNSSTVPPSHTKQASCKCPRFCLFACTTSYFFFTTRFLEIKYLFYFVNDEIFFNRYTLMYTLVVLYQNTHQ